MMTRRSFLQTAAALTVMTAAPSRADSMLPIRMAVEYNMLPASLSMLQRFQLARECGYEQIECPTTPDKAEAEAMKAASEKLALPIHSVMNMDHWKYPFTSSNPADVERGLEGARTSIRNAHLWRASTVLLVPGVVNAQTSYKDAFTRVRWMDLPPGLDRRPRAPFKARLKAAACCSKWERQRLRAP